MEINITMAENGYIMKVSEGEEQVLSVYESDNIESVIHFVYVLLEALGYSDNKWTERPENINLYAAPGRKADTISHVRAWLTDFAFEPSEELVQQVTKVIHDSYEEEV